VDQPLSLTPDELRRLTPEHQITLHKCIQGWGYKIVKWVRSMDLIASYDDSRAGRLARTFRSSFRP
jgi:DMSO/TMAO reductase YedYZ molybdopterin-dependent catalytic subunit